MQNIKISNLYVNVEGEKYINIPALYTLSCDVYIIFGERTGGKTYSVFKGMLDEYNESGAEFCYMRTREDYIRGIKGYRAIANNKEYCEKTLWKSEYTLNYRSGEYYKVGIDKKFKNIYTPIGHAMSIGGWMKYKSNGYDKVETIFFDEFIEDTDTSTIRQLSHDEFIKGYMQNISTIVRRRKNVKIVCCANALNPKSPLFDYYGIDARHLKQGRIYIFNKKLSDNSALKICCLYTEAPERVEVDKHIAVYENDVSDMTLHGVWQERKYVSTYKGINWRYIANKSNCIYISDIKLTVAIPHNTKMPLVLIDGKYKTTLEIDIKDLYLYASRLKTLLLYYYQVENVISSCQKASELFTDLIRRLTIDKN